MFEPRFRTATAADVGELIWLETISRDALVDQRGGDLWLAAHPPESPNWLSVGAGDVTVSTIDGVTVGYVRIRVADGVVYVEDVFVHPGAREVGCGDGLLAEAVRQGTERGARRIEAVALPGDRETKNLYERAGITAKRIIVSSPIGDEST